MHDYHFHLLVIASARVCVLGNVGGGAISSVVLEGSSFKTVILSLCKLHQESSLLCCDWLLLQHLCVSVFVCMWVWVPNEPINNDCFLCVCVSSCPLRGDVKVSVNLMLPPSLSIYLRACACVFNPDPFLKHFCQTILSKYEASHSPLSEIPLFKIFVSRNKSKWPR